WCAWRKDPHVWNGRATLRSASFPDPVPLTTPHAAILLLCGLIFEPEVFETRAVVDAVDHQRQPFHPRLPAGGLTGIEDDRTNVVLGQSPLDLPHQLLAFVPVRLP